MSAASPYPPIGDYALIGDCHAAALVSSVGSIDWCCLPRFDSPSCFGRLLDWEKGGYCAITADDGNATITRRYLDGTLILETMLRAGGAEVRLLDCFTMRAGGKAAPRRQLLRIVEGVRGKMALQFRCEPRFDYGAFAPWMRREGKRVYSAIGGENALGITADVDLVLSGQHDINAAFTIQAGERVRFSLHWDRPENLDTDPPHPYDPVELDKRFVETLEWWRRWAAAVHNTGADDVSILRSAITLKALTNAPTGAIIAAPTTSLPEAIGGERNWDYRYSWIRDSTLTAHALTAVQCEREADGFRRFIQRSSAGSAHGLQIVYGVGGERRLTEATLDHLDGYRGSRPVRIGNGAAAQVQLDVYGHLLELSWRWHERGDSPDDDYWRFLTDLVNVAAERWQEPDRGIWEIRGAPRHFVHSKVMCWVALDRGLRLAKECLRKAPERRWKQTRDAIRNAIESEGYDAERGVFTQSFGSGRMDAALLLLPQVEFVPYDDPRMIRTTEAVRTDLEHDGLLMRYRTDKTDDDLKGNEGPFLACTFWFAECLAQQGKQTEARAAFDRAAATGNDLGLFAEEYDVRAGELRGNFPQGLTHIAHIAAAVTLASTHHDNAPPLATDEV